MKHIVLQLVCFLLIAILPACSPSSPLEETAQVSTWLEEGRALLDADQPEVALRVFELAHRSSPSLETHLWVLRSWISLGRNNDALNAIDELRDTLKIEGTEVGALELDYLYGMAFAYRGRAHVLAGVTDGAVRISFEDATNHLKRVVEQGKKRFPDAALWLARSAWAIRKREIAREAAELSCRLHPKSAESWLALGRVAIGQFVALHSPPLDPFAAPTDDPPPSRDFATWAPETQAHWLRGEEAFRRTIALLGIPSAPKDQTDLARAGLELGHALSWRGQFEEAADAYALSVAFNPDGTDYRTLANILQDPDTKGEEARLHSSFLRALESGTLAFQARVGQDDERDGTLLYWLGYARWRAGRLASAIAAFELCLDKLPEASNAWFYIAMCRYDQGLYELTADTLRKGWAINAPAIVKEMQVARDDNVRKLDWVISKLPEKRLEDRAILSEIAAETAQIEVRHWNNMGLFMRDAADRLKADPGQTDEFLRLSREALRAYQRGLKLTPEDPQMINDTAVILHYNLEENLDTALEMYDLAEKLALEVLKKPELTPDDRTRFETALRDARNNRTELRGRLKPKGTSH